MLTVIALAWIPVIKGASGLYVYLQSVQSYLAPPIFVVFFFGVFWKRLNAKGCLWALIIGFVLGIFRLLVDTPVTLGMKDVYAPGSMLWIVQNINFQYFSILITLVSALVMVGVSYMTAAPDYATIQNLSFGTRTDQHKRDSAASWDWRDIVTSAVVLVVIIAGYLYFVG